MSNMRHAIETAVVLCLTGTLAVTSAAKAESTESRKAKTVTAGLSAEMRKLMTETDLNKEVASTGTSVSTNPDWTEHRVVGTGNVLHSAGLSTELINLLMETNSTIEKTGVELVAAGLSADMIGIASGTDEESPADTADNETSDSKEVSGDSAEEGTGDKQTDKPEEAFESEEEKQWKNYLMADVNEFLNVRADKSEDSEVVGKLRKGDRALIKKKGKTWTKIASGEVEGYVKNKYCVMGSKALDYAKKHCDRIATVLNDGLRVRKKQNTDSKILDRMSEGDTLTVNLKAKTKEGWTAVKTDSGTGYVRSEYVKLSYRTTKAITIEEEQAAKEQAAEVQSGKESGSSTESSAKVKGSSLAASADETTLLAALIYCEAGGQSYECQLGVGAVVVNRIKSGRFPGSMYKVIYQSGQFGPAITGKLERRLARGVSSSSRRAAEEALSGVDNTGGCLFFNDSFCGHDGLEIDGMVFWN